MRTRLGTRFAFVAALALCLLAVGAPTVSAQRRDEPVVVGHVPPPPQLHVATARKAARAKVQSFKDRSSLVDRVSFAGCDRETLKRVTCTFKGRGGAKAGASACRLTVVVEGVGRHFHSALSASCRSTASGYLTFHRATRAIRTAAEELARRPVVIAFAKRLTTAEIVEIVEWDSKAQSTECSARFVARLASAKVTVTHAPPTCTPAFEPPG